MSISLMRRRNMIRGLEERWCIIGTGSYNQIGECATEIITESVKFEPLTLRVKYEQFTPTKRTPTTSENFFFSTSKSRVSQKSKVSPKLHTPTTGNPIPIRRPKTRYTNVKNSTVKNPTVKNPKRLLTSSGESQSDQSCSTTGGAKVKVKITKKSTHEKRTSRYLETRTRRRSTINGIYAAFYPSNTALDIIFCTLFSCNFQLFWCPITRSRE